MNLEGDNAPAWTCEPNRYISSLRNVYDISWRKTRRGMALRDFIKRGMNRKVKLKAIYAQGGEK